MDNKFDGVAFVEKLKELSGEEKQVTLAEKLAGFEDNCVQKASSWEKKLSGWKGFPKTYSFLHNGLRFRK